MKPNQISEALKPLMVFNGTWNVEGKNLSWAPAFANAPLTGTQKVDVMGTRFLVANWNYKVDKTNEHSGIMIIGTDTDSSKPKVHLFDNEGSLRVYELKIDDHLWTLKGEEERATLEFAKDGKTYRELWEIKHDGTWKPLCERNGTKTLQNDMNLADFGTITE